MGFCEFCGEKYKGGKFCPSCGKVLSSAMAPEKPSKGSGGSQGTPYYQGKRNYRDAARRPGGRGGGGGGGWGSSGGGGDDRKNVYRPPHMRRQEGGQGSGGGGSNVAMGGGGGGGGGGGEDARSFKLPPCAFCGEKLKGGKFCPSCGKVVASAMTQSAVAAGADLVAPPVAAPPAASAAPALFSPPAPSPLSPISSSLFVPPVSSSPAVHVRPEEYQEGMVTSFLEQLQLGVYEPPKPVYNFGPDDDDDDDEEEEEGAKGKGEYREDRQEEEDDDDDGYGEGHEQQDDPSMYVPQGLVGELLPDGGFQDLARYCDHCGEKTVFSICGMCGEQVF